MEDICQMECGTIRGYYWITGTTAADFEAAVSDDPTVANPRLLTDLETEWLYRVECTEAAATTFADLAALDITILSAQATQQGWDVVFRFPDRETISEFRERERAIGNDVDVRRLYREETRKGVAGSTVTPAQRDALVTAYEAGFFDVPRETTQRAIAATLNISAQSLSERLRRGTASLIEATIQDERL